jgi:isoleucyl-tRNA synthetase
LIYRDNKPVYWSPSSKSALAEAELEYDDNHMSKAAFIKFPIQNTPPNLRKYRNVDTSNLSAVVWTTTPWTLPANKAIAIHKDLKYTILGYPLQHPLFGSTGQLLVGQGRVDHIRSLSSHFNELDTVVDNIPGEALLGSGIYLNPLHREQAEAQPIIHASFVSASSGSGLVHIAPGHGMDDFNICSKLGIEPFAPVDDAGAFTALALPSQPDLLSGKPVQGSGTEAVLNYLRTLSDEQGKHTNLVLHTHEYTHKYPIDWRTKQPVLIRATEQWFANVDAIKNQALRALECVKFIPESGRSRLESFIKGRSHWCVSRQRAWGVPIPALFRQHSSGPEAVMTGDTIEHIINVIKVRGIDAWWTDAEDDPAWIPENLAGTFRRGKDTMDVWFDSGTSWATLPERGTGQCLADVCIEGTDQHRGWFQSLILSHVAHQAASAERDDLEARPPFNTLITHGFTLDQEGRKMSKSLGNVVSPSDIIRAEFLPDGKGHQSKRQGSTKNTALGVDALRLWVASGDYTKDVVIGQQVLKAVQTNLHKYRITFKWILGALEDFTIRDGDATNSPSSGRLTDRIARHHLKTTLDAVRCAYKEYSFFQGATSISKYVNNDLSAFYFEAIKDRIYAGALQERRPAQLVLLEILEGLSLMLAPLTPVLVEEVYRYTPPQLRREGKYSFQRTWRASVEDGFEDDKVLQAQLPFVMAAHSAVKQAQETARLAKKMASGLECDVKITLPVNAAADALEVFSKRSSSEFEEAFVVSSVGIETGTLSGRSETNLEGDAWQVVAHFDVQSTSGAPAVVQLRPPSRDKCPRCWRYLAPQVDTLCKRCDALVGNDPGP